MRPSRHLLSTNFGLSRWMVLSPNSPLARSITRCKCSPGTRTSVSFPSGRRRRTRNESSVSIGLGNRSCEEEAQYDVLRLDPSPIVLDRQRQGEVFHGLELVGGEVMIYGQPTVDAAGRIAEKLRGDQDSSSNCPVTRRYCHKPRSTYRRSITYEPKRSFLRSLRRAETDACGSPVASLMASSVCQRPSRMKASTRLCCL